MSRSSLSESTIREDTAERHVGKYANRMLIHQLFLGRFLDRVASRLSSLPTESVLDFGCGEALFWKEMKARGVQIERLLGLDLRKEALAEAADAHPEHEFLEQDVLEFEADRHFSLVVASQVLEHLPSPERFLRRLVELNPDYLLLTVPWEPYFRLGNLLRGRDVARLGNHPEHVNLWGARSFEAFVGQYAEVLETDHVMPFLMVIARPRQEQ